MLFKTTCFALTLILHTVAADRDLIFFSNTCTVECDGGNFLMSREAPDQSQCDERCVAGMWTWFLRLLGWDCEECLPLLPQEINHADGFFCDEDIITLNQNPGTFEYPQFQDHPTIADRCFLRLNAEVSNPGRTAVSAFQAFEFHPSNPSRIFSAVFDYRVYGQWNPEGEGMAFVMQRDVRGAEALGGIGGHMGVYGDDIIYPALVIELDSWKNIIEIPFQDDSAYHIHIMTTAPFSSVNELAETSEYNFRTDNAGNTVGRVWIEYCGTGVLNVFVNPNGSTKPTLPQVSTPFNFAAFFGVDNVSFDVGFTSGTVFAADNHDILSWTMQQSC